jgi:predicted MFS family arabinose efflux permease
VPRSARRADPPPTPLALIFSVTLIAIMGNSLIAPVVPDLLADLDVGDGGAGFVIAAVALPGVVVAPLIGLMADRLGRRAVLVPCLVIFGWPGWPWPRRRTSRCCSPVASCRASAPPG